MFELLIIIICLMLNAILSCIEMAFVTVSRGHLKQLALKNNTAAQRILKLKENPERTLSVLQIGLTLGGSISAAVGGASAENKLSPILQTAFSVNPHAGNILAIFLFIIPLTYISVVLGELVPKSLALKHPMKLALLGGILLQFLDKIFAPFIFILEISTRLILQAISKSIASENLQDDTTLIDIETLSNLNKQYVFNLIHVDKKLVGDIYIPWEEVSIVHQEDHFHTVMKKIKESRHTRLPVLKGEEVIGLLHAKEFTSENEITRIDWTQLIRPLVKVNVQERILPVLKKLQANHSHIALVMEYGKPLGIITIEDIVEEFVGDITDEDDNARAILSTNSKLRSKNRPSS